MIGNETILFETGVKQADPVEPVLFALALDEIAIGVRSPNNIWYLDDATIGGPLESFCKDLRRKILMLSDIGIEVNPSESDISNISCANFQSVMLAIESTLLGITVTEREDLSILGAPIGINSCRTGMSKAAERLPAMSSRLESTDAHPAFFLFRNCLSMPHLLFKLRSSSCYRLHSDLTQFDKISRQAASTVSNIKFDDTRWQQSTIPVAQGGHDLSTTVNAYASSLSTTRQHVGQIFKDIF